MIGAVGSIRLHTVGDAGVQELVAVRTKVAQLLVKLRSIASKPL